MGIIFLPLMFLALWAIVILPQQRRMKAHRALVSVLEVGNEVMTTSGIIGTITAIDDEVLHLEVAPGVTLRIVRAAIAQRMNEPEPEPAPEPELTDADAEADHASGIGEPASVPPADGESSGTTS
ncbi:MAG TPA: preprotein translocase subunit YajC [Acidimicrobiales bacterium]|nr:preprotein translocase subunit YajC [Acidimicrobiales bacterium]